MIQKLSEKIIKQIAAGEVISKPYNAVKELIENSIDAKAKNIKLFFEEYGMQSIIIIDDGCGIAKQDLKLAPQLHTTSKTNESDVLFGINYFGFRGEALASIDAISTLIIESNGNKLENEQISHSTIETGTKITIKNLFKNVPARLKFIKNEQNEFRIIKDLIKKLMVQHNEISWAIIANNKTIWNLKAENKINRIKDLFKEEAIQEYASNENLRINAFILKKQSNVSIIFVNKRLVNDKAIFRYISSLFKEYTFIHENPGYILEITIDPILVDYNVHPSKEEIKFMNYSEIFAMLNSIFSMNNLANKLNNTDIIFEQPSSYFSPSSIIKNIERQSFIQENDDLNIFSYENSNNQTFINTEKEIENIKHEKLLMQTEMKINLPFKLIGQLQNSYILFENENGLGIFDQHAAHERHIYEALKSNLNKNSSQKLLSTIPLNLTEEQKIFLNENLLNLEEKGVYIENYELTAIPITFKNISDLVKTLENIEVSSNIETEIDRLLANVACKNALKANTQLSFHQMENLLIESLKNPPICNHGRPVFKYFSNNDIKNFFKRT